jgi:hypothetical protein
MFYPLALKFNQATDYQNLDDWNDSDEKVDEAPLLDGEAGA